CLAALLRLDAAGFKKTLRFPFLMEGMAPNGRPLEKPEDIDAFFKMIMMAPGIKEELKKMSFTLSRVVPVDQFLQGTMPQNDFRRQFLEKENVFLSKFRKPEVLVVYVVPKREGRPEMGRDEGAVFVRVAAGRAWVVGFGQSRQERAKKK